MGFLWEVGPVWVYLFWILIFVLQMLVAEMHRRWTWTAFALWTVGGVLAIPYVIIHGVPTVSYTHLDLYKRQALVFPSSRNLHKP